MKAILLALLSLTALSGCATPWPTDMPPTTYSGTVFNQLSGKNEPNVQISATRLCVTPGLIPGQTFVPVDPSVETMAVTRSGKEGKFTLKTSSGYAEMLWAKTSDGSMVGSLSLDSKKDERNLIVILRPNKPSE